MTMKKQMTSFDVAVEARELSRLLTGGFVDKVYQPAKDEILLRINVPSEGKKDLFIKLGKFALVTKRAIEMPEVPSNFAMLLRKNLDNARVMKVSQHKFDRIMKFELQKAEGYMLIVELFADGNVILAKNGRIVAPLIPQSWRDREVRAGEDYVYPPSRADPRDMNFDDFAKVVRTSNADLVRTLAVGVNLGGLYAEETCLLAGKDKSIKAATIEDEDLEDVFRTIKGLIERLSTEQKPEIIVDKGRYIDVVPIEMTSYDAFEKKEYPYFNEALDDYFSEIAKYEAAGLPAVSNEKVERLKRQIEQQRSAIDELAAGQERDKMLGDAIYSNYSTVEKALAGIIEAKDRLGWTELMKQFAKAKKEREGNERKDGEKYRIEELNPQDGYFVMRIFEDGEVSIKLDIRKSINENAQEYYEKAKKWREKIEGAKAAMEEARKKLEDAEEEAEEMLATRREAAERAKRASRRYWYESYRWFISSDGNLVLAGKDAETNDKVVKKHLKDDDRYVHADVHGAPSVVVKKKLGKDITESTLREACEYAVCFSRAWGSNVGSERAYWVTPSQVSKTPQSGEFLARGAFVIRGKRNYCEEVPLRLAIGEIFVDKSTGENLVTPQDVEGRAVQKIMCAPVSAVEKHSNRYAIIEPGDTPKNEFAGALSRALGMNMEDALSVLPPSGVRVAKLVGLELR